jgi:endonuclease I
VEISNGFKYNLVVTNIPREYFETSITCIFYYKTDANTTYWSKETSTSVKEIAHAIKNETWLTSSESDFINSIVPDDEIIGGGDSTYTGTYYDNLGTVNVANLRNLISVMTKKSYGDAGSGGLMIEADRYFIDGNPTDYVLGIYNSVLLDAVWRSDGSIQREHVWPNGRLGIERVNNSTKNQGSDLHNLRAINGINQTRSDYWYTNDPNNPALGHVVTSGTSFYPGFDFRGDVARIVLYMAVRYDFLKLTSNTSLLSDYTAYIMDYANMGDASLFASWNTLDPVDAFEIRRNNVIYSYQNNRNPFIDHPEWFATIIADSSLWRN